MCADGDAFVDRVNHIRTMTGIHCVENAPYPKITKQTYDWGIG